MLPFLPNSWAWNPQAGSAVRIRDFTATYTPSIVVSYLTAVIVRESFLEKARRDQRNTSSELRRALLPCLNAHVSVLSSIYTEAVDEINVDEYEDFSDILEEDYIESIEGLDLNTSRGKNTYQKALDQSNQNLVANFEEYIQSYAAHEEGQFIRDLRSLKDDKFIDMIQTLESEFSSSSPNTIDPAIKQVFSDHVEQFLRVLDHFEEEDMPDVSELALRRHLPRSKVDVVGTDTHTEYDSDVADVDIEDEVFEHL
jgi:hypothetical protein